MRTCVLVAAAALACNNLVTGPSDKITPPLPPAAIYPDPLDLADVSNPTTVVTNCNEAALAAAIAQGGVITLPTPPSLTTARGAA